MYFPSNDILVHPNHTHLTQLRPSYFISLFSVLTPVDSGEIWEKIKIIKLNENKLGWTEPHSRFTLGIPLGFPMNFAYEMSHGFYEHWISCSWGFHFNIMKSSSIGDSLHFKQYSIFVWSPWLKFKIWGRSDQLLLNYF